LADNTGNPSTRQFTILEKRDLMQALGTAATIKGLIEQESELQKELEAENQLKLESSDYIHGRSDDCKAVKQLEAEIAMQIPEKDGEKKLTETDKKGWLARQRKENKPLSEAVAKQKMAEIAVGDIAIRQEMARTRIGDLRSILALRTAQISFFAGDVRIIIEDPDIEKEKAEIAGGKK
jgi:hypothetical protein